MVVWSMPMEYGTARLRRGEKMTGNKQYVFLCKLRYAAVTVFLAALMAFPAYGYYDGSAGELRNDFSISDQGIPSDICSMAGSGRRDICHL